jgi:hypothetical protein
VGALAISRLAEDLARRFELLMDMNILTLNKKGFFALASGAVLKLF